MPNLQVTDPVTRDKHTTETVRRQRQKPGAKAQKRMAVVLAAIAAGKTIDEATAEVGVGPEAYKMWRKQDPEFRAKVERARAKLKGATPPRVSFGPKFREKYLYNDFDPPINPRHLLVAMDFVNRLKPGEFGLILMPPEHAKTTIGEDWLTQGPVDDPEIRQVVISKSQGEAIKRLATVQHRYEDEDFYPELIETFGPLKPYDRSKTWAATKMEVERKSPKHRDYTLQALGIGGQIQGQRIIRALLDDVEDDQNFNQYEAHAHYVRQSVNTRLGVQGIGLMIGTRQNEMDVYRFLMDEEFFDHVLVLPAVFEEDFEYVMQDGTVVRWEEGETLWPERYSDEDYARFQRKAGTRTWTLTYQQKDEVSEGMSFPRKLIEQCFNDELESKIIPLGNITVAGLDPSAVNMTAATVLGVQPRTLFRTWIDQRFEKGLVGEGGDIQEGLIEFILKVVGDYRVRILTLEANSAFTLLESSVKLRTGLTNLGCRLLTVTSSGNGLRSGGEEVKDLAISHLSNVFANRIIQIPSKGMSKMTYKQAINQFVRWRKGQGKKIPKDHIKAFQFAEFAARNIRLVLEEEQEIEGLEHLPKYLRDQYRTVATG